jgi:hypothetical protein
VYIIHTYGYGHTHHGKPLRGRNLGEFQRGDTLLYGRDNRTHNISIVLHRGEVGLVDQLCSGSVKIPIVLHGHQAKGLGLANLLDTGLSPYLLLDAGKQFLPGVFHIVGNHGETDGFGGGETKAQLVLSQTRLAAVGCFDRVRLVSAGLRGVITHGGSGSLSNGSLSNAEVYVHKSVPGPMAEWSPWVGVPIGWDSWFVVKRCGIFIMPTMYRVKLL